MIVQSESHYYARTLAKLFNLPSFKVGSALSWQQAVLNAAGKRSRVFSNWPYFGLTESRCFRRKSVGNFSVT